MWIADRRSHQVSVADDQSTALEGTLIGSLSVRSSVPTFFTVNVYVTGTPTDVLPKLALPVSSAMSAAPSST